MSNIDVIQRILQFCKIGKFAYGEFNERSFSNPHPRPTYIQLRDAGDINLEDMTKRPIVGGMTWAMFSIHNQLFTRGYSSSGYFFFRDACN